MKYDLTFLELELRELLKKLKKHNTYAMQLEDEIRLYALENAKLKEKNEELMSLYTSERYVKEDYKLRNSKAIEYIEEKVGNEIHDMMYVIDVSDLLDILKEGDKE